MQILSYDKYIEKSRDGKYKYNLDGTWIEVAETDTKTQQVCEDIMKALRKKDFSQIKKISIVNANIQLLPDFKTEWLLSGLPEDSASSDTGELSKEDYISCMNRIINHFSEFEFQPNLRFINTINSILCEKGKEGPAAVVNYIEAYMELTGNAAAGVIRNKCNNYEWKETMKMLARHPVKRAINNRLEFKYGAQGTGKTTKALEQTEGRNIVCHSAMLPCDLMEDFAFDDGKAGFHKSALWQAMEGGYSITMDEINLLPFESLRFLQSITDEKPYFIYKGQTVNIKEGFKIIGTMNLFVNGSAYTLPEPLVDRAAALEKYVLTAEQITSVLF